jgi:hypothetical protein
MAIRGSMLAALVLMASPLLTAGPSSAAVPPWEVSTAQSVGGQNLILNSVHVPAAGDVWTVGYRWGTVGGALEFRTLIEHSTGGGSFQMVASPDREGAPATNFLQDIAGPSPSDLWAVGWSRNPGQPSRTLVERWNGTAWSIWPSADPGPVGNILNGVVSLGPDDAWAVGARQDTFYQSPLAEHWNGSTWSAVTVPNPAFCTGHSYLTDVAVRAPSAVFATGICTSSTSGGDQGFVVQWNGRKWLLSAVNSLIPVRGSLSSISIDQQVVWLVGTSATDGAFAMRSKGSGWVRIPLTERDSTFAAVVARPGGSAWAVGTAPSPQAPFAGPGSMRLTSVRGLSQTIPVDFGSLRGIAWDPAGRLWAVGTQLPGANDIPLIVSRVLR